MKKLFLKSLALIMMLTMSVSMEAATKFCETPSGHLGNADFGDRNACVKLTISKSSEAGFVDVTLAMNRDLSATSKIDYIYVLYNGLPYTAGTDDNGDALDELTAHVNVGGAASGNLMIQYSNPNWGGRWQIELADVDFTATCSTGVERFSVNAIAGVGGSASVSSSFAEAGDELTFKATPECGYTFESWTNNGIVVVGAGATYTTTITENTTLQANFTGSGVSEVVENPSHDAANVTSIYGYYGSATDLAMNPDWGQATQYTTLSIAGKEVTKYSNLNYQGIHFANMNVSDMQYVHFDIYAYADADLDIFLITVGGESYQRKHLTACEWNSIDILLSDYVAQGRDLTNVYEFKFDAQNTGYKGKTMLIQNIYFYKLPAEPVSGVTLDKTEATVKKDKTLQLTATVAPVAAENKNVSWESNNTDVATVSATGLVTAVDYGTATITVTTEDGNKTATCVVTVPAPNPDEVTLTADGKTIVYTAYLIDDNQYQLTITSDDKMIRHTGSFWYVNGVGGTALMADGNFAQPDDYTIVITVTSTQAPQLYTPLYINMPGQVNFGQPTFTWLDKRPTVDVTGVTVEATAEVEVGKTVTLHATIAPANASNKDVTWESENEEIATVENGVVTGVAAGTVNIIVKSIADPSKTATCEVTVSAEPVVSDWVTLTNGANEIRYLAAHYIGTNVYSLTIEGVSANIAGMGGSFWNTNEGAVRVDAHMTQINASTIQLMAEYNQGPQIYTPLYVMMPGEVNFDYITIEWLEKEAPVTPATGVSLDKTSLELGINETYTLVPTVAPALATNKNVTWESSNTDVATVSESGLVTAKAVGNATITVKTVDGNYTATCAITVIAAIEPTVVNGEAYAEFADGLVAVYTYTITRTAERHVVVAATFDRDMTGRIEPANYELWINGVQNNMTYEAATKTATLDLGSKTDGETLNLNFRFVLNGGGLAVKAVTYTVGTSQAAPTTKLVSINDIVENADQAEPVNVVLGRSFVADGGLYTLSLPFSMTAEQIADAFGSCYIAQLASVEERGADMLHLNFDYVDAIVAGVPYLFLPEQHITNPTINGVTLNYTAKSSGDAKAKMHAVLQPTHDPLPANAYFLGDDNYLYAVDENNNGMKGLRAYFTLATAPSGVAPRAKVVLGTNTTTGMENATINHGAQKVLIDGQLYILRAEGMFNVQGQLVK